MKKSSHNGDSAATPATPATGTAAHSSGDIELLQLQLNDAEQKLAQMTELGKRAVADMENMKRRLEEDRSRMALFANIDLLRGILPALDNFKRSQAHIPENLPDNAKEWVNGIHQIFNQLSTTINQAGVFEMDALGRPFDPNFHEAVLQDKGPKDQVLEILEPGYMLGEHVVRPAKVKVGMGT